MPEQMAWVEKKLVKTVKIWGPQWKLSYQVLHRPRLSDDRDMELQLGTLYANTQWSWHSTHLCLFEAIHQPLFRQFPRCPYLHGTRWVHHWSFRAWRDRSRAWWVHGFWQMGALRLQAKRRGIRRFGHGSKWIVCRNCRVSL